MKTPKDRMGIPKVSCACCGELITEGECEMIRTKRGTTMYFKPDHAREILEGKRPWWNKRIT